MDLQNNHRRALLDELEAAQSDLETARRCLDSEPAKEDLALAEAFEIKHFLAKSRVELIKNCLTDNYIDY